MINTLGIERPNCLGMKCTLLLQGLHVFPSPAHFLQWTLYVTSPRPPLSLGGLHSSVTAVSFRVEMGFSGADGGPGREKEKIQK